MKRLIAAGVLAGLLVPPARIADAGCICPDLTNVRVGDLRVTNATVAAQRWTIANDRIEVELELRGATPATTIDVLAIGVPTGEMERLRELAGLNNTAGADPLATASVDETELPVTVDSNDTGVRARWSLGAVAKGAVTVKLDTLPISLCAKNVKKLGKQVFEIRGRGNLQDKRGVLPIMFGTTI